jgi:hypothetical protein
MIDLRTHQCPACAKAWACLANKGWPPKADPLPCVYPVGFLCPPCAREGAA